MQHPPPWRPPPLRAPSAAISASAASSSGSMIIQALYSAFHVLAAGPTAAAGLEAGAGACMHHRHHRHLRGSPSSEEDMFSGLGRAQRVCTFVSHRYTESCISRVQCISRGAAFHSFRLSFLKSSIKTR